MANRRRRALSSGLAVAIVLASTTLLTAGAALTAAPAAADDTCATPNLQNVALSNDPYDRPTYTVPAGVHRVVLTVGGQAGQDWSLNGSSFSGGRGTNVQVVMDVTPGQKLQNGVLPGGLGGGSPLGPDTGENLDAIGPDGGRGGMAGFWAVVGQTIPGDQDPFNDGPRVCLIPIVAAAGGGGAGGDPGIANAPPGASAGGDADTGTGAGAGGNGGDNSAVDGAGGQGATAAGGGAGGAFGYGEICPDGFSGTSGGLLSGGAGGKGHPYNKLGGGTSCHAGTGAGGGGAGYYFGGGGGSGEGTHASGGGGGGSPYIDPSVLTVSETATALGAAMDPDNPTLAPVYDTSTTLNSSLNPSVQGDDVTLTADVSTVNPDFQVGGGTVTFRDFSNSGATLGSASAVPNSDGTATASYTTSTLPPGTHSIGASYGGYGAAAYSDRSSQSAHVSQSVTPTQTISFTSTAPASATAYGSTYAVSATATSGLPVSFSIDPAAAAVCSVTGTTVSFVGAGTCVVDADQDGNPGYAPAATVHQDTTVAAGASQTIAFTSTPPAIVHVNDSYVVTATGGGSGKPVLFSIPPGNACSIQVGNTVKCSVGGTWTIDADQAGGNSYAPAPQAHQQITIQPGPQTITFDSTPPASPQTGNTYVVHAHASSGGNVALTLDSTSAGCSLSNPRT
ncbi:MAG: Endoglucanase-like protein, partial [Acidimicrobiales bacterium]|nr:Endoglucanase-like protein [Acidimicrobiales bacterium]